MKKIFTILAGIALVPAAGMADGLPLPGYDKTPERVAERTIQYQPGQSGMIVSENGINRYTRALYGGPTLFRVETSDRPIFGAYHKKDNRNIRFRLRVGEREKWLDEAEAVLSAYIGPTRFYWIQDRECLGPKGIILLQVLAPEDSESAIFFFTTEDLPAETEITGVVSPTVKVKLNRSGDMGVDPAGAFDADPAATDLKTAKLQMPNHSPVVFRYFDRDITADDQQALLGLFEKAQKEADLLATRIQISTPDPYLNALGSTLSHAGNGIWDGKTYQHGAIGWRMPLSGWRGAFAGDFLGWHDRARIHFDAYAASQVTDVPPTIPHPSQDSTMNIARARKEWGTQMYSNGYICRNPERNNQMHHYDMNLCYIDELLWHLQWTGDLDYARRMWPTIKASLEWEKRNYDPDGDSLYDAYCCIWASDALYYNSGAVTHSSAYNHRANKIVAEIAELIGEDPTPYREEARRIKAAMDSVLWMKDRGVWAEFKDFMGARRLHTHPGVWTVYHAIDGDVASPEQAYAATRYVDACIPHIPVTAKGFKGDDLETISTTDWLPYAWSINNVAFAEVYQTALAYYQAGRPDEATKLMKSAILDGMYIGNSPGNIGQISYYDAARSETYRDFADPVGVLSRTVVQGLFGFTPEALGHKATIRPGFPSDWNHAEISHPDFSYRFSRDGLTDTYSLDVRLDSVRTVDLDIPMAFKGIAEVKVGGKPVSGWTVKSAPGRPRLTFSVAPNDTVEILWKDAPAYPAGVEAIEIPAVAFNDIPATLGIDLITGSKYDPVDLSKYFNSNADDIFLNEYLSPRSPYTTLQIPKQGIGEWCHPAETATIEDDGLRAASVKGVFTTPQGIPFRTPAEGPNVVYTSLFDNYPDSVVIPLKGKARALDLLLAGSTNHMQIYLENARVTVAYADGTSENLSLVPPFNWVPIEQDYFVDGKAFRLPTPRPYRVTLKGALVSNNLEKDLGINDVYGRRIEGGAGLLLSLPLDPSKKLKSMTLTAVSTDIVAGVMAATLVR